METIAEKRAKILRIQTSIEEQLVKKDALLAEIQAVCPHEKVIMAIQYDGNGTNSTHARCLFCGLEESGLDNARLKILCNRPTKLLSNNEWGKGNSLLQPLKEIKVMRGFVLNEVPQ